MGTYFKKLVMAGLLFSAFYQKAQASQEVYLSESPNGKYRVIVHQEIFRRVGDQPFFKYPITALNIHTRRSVDIHNASVPLVEETEKGTFKVNWESVHFDWSKNSRNCFMTLEVMPGTWKTFFVDVVSLASRDVTEELKEDLLDRVAHHAWSCEAAKITLDHWFNPNIPVFKITSDCGKNKNSENNKLFRITDFVVFDAHKRKIVQLCNECDSQKAEKIAWQYFQSTQVTPTPTPVPEETPGVSQ